MKRLVMWSLFPVLFATLLVGHSRAAAAPIGLGSGKGRMYEQSYYHSTCWFTFSFSGAMPTKTTRAILTQGSAYSSHWACEDPTTTIDSDVWITMSGTTLSGERTNWICLSHVAGDAGSYDGFSGLTATCWTSGGGTTFQWSLRQSTRGASHSDYQCDPYKLTCASSPFTASYTATGKLLPKV